MHNLIEPIKEVDLNLVSETTFKTRCVGAIVLTQDNKILLQKTVYTRKFFPKGSIITFGGHMEEDETPIQSLVRELEEELGAKVITHDTVYLGAITEAVTNYTELVYCYFWHDKENTITGCYEDEPIYFDNIKEIMKTPKVTDDIKWMLKKCLELDLVNHNV